MAPGKTEAKQMELQAPLSLEGLAGLGLGLSLTAESAQTSAGSRYVRATSELLLYLQVE